VPESSASTHFSYDSHYKVQREHQAADGQHCSRTFFTEGNMRIKTLLNNACEQIVYWSFKRILLGYAKVFAAGLFHLEARHDRFESQVKVVAEHLLQATLRLDARVRALESKGAQQ